MTPLITHSITNSQRFAFQKRVKQFLILLEGHHGQRPNQLRWFAQTAVIYRVFPLHFGPPWMFHIRSMRIPKNRVVKPYLWLGFTFRKPVLLSRFKFKFLISPNSENLSKTWNENCVNGTSRNHESNLIFRGFLVNTSNKQNPTLDGSLWSWFIPILGNRVVFHLLALYNVIDSSSLIL